MHKAETFPLDDASRQSCATFGEICLSEVLVKQMSERDCSYHTHRLTMTQMCVTAKSVAIVVASIHAGTYRSATDGYWGFLVAKLEAGMSTPM